MPIGTLTVAAIAELAFSSFLESAAGKVAEQFTEATLQKASSLINQLYRKIRDRLWQKSEEAQAAIVSVEQGSDVALNQVIRELQAEMADDLEFAKELRQIAQQIVNIEELSGNVQYNQGDGYQAIGSHAPVFQGVDNSPITINYNAPPQP